MFRRATPSALVFITIFYSFCSDEISPAALPEDSFDIILVVGQSNTLAGSGYNRLFDKTRGITQLGRFGNHDYKIIWAEEPLEHHSPRKNQIGFALGFARNYRKEFAAHGRSVLIIPCGKGGTGFRGHHWNKGDELYNDAVDRTNYCLNKFPNSKVVAILWHQGESDVGYVHYEAHLDSMIVNMRKDLHDKNIPFILGGMVPYWVSRDTARMAIQELIRSTPLRIRRTAYVDPTKPFIISKRHNDDDEVHYDASGQRELARRYFETYTTLTKTEH